MRASSIVSSKKMASNELYSSICLLNTDIRIYFEYLLHNNYNEKVEITTIRSFISSVQYNNRFPHPAKQFRSCFRPNKIASNTRTIVVQICPATGTRTACRITSVSFSRCWTLQWKTLRRWLLAI